MNYLKFLFLFIFLIFGVNSVFSANINCYNSEDWKYHEESTLIGCDSGDIVLSVKPEEGVCEQEGVNYSKVGTKQIYYGLKNNSGPIYQYIVSTKKIDSICKGGIKKKPATYPEPSTAINLNYEIGESTTSLDGTRGDSGASPDSSSDDSNTVIDNTDVMNVCSKEGVIPNLFFSKNSCESKSGYENEYGYAYTTILI
jgi:hypothetical protein